MKPSEPPIAGADNVLGKPAERGCAHHSLLAAFPARSLLSEPHPARGVAKVGVVVGQRSRQPVPDLPPVVPVVQVSDEHGVVRDQTAGARELAYLLHRMTTGDWHAAATRQ
ncbi:hypothetical protein [Catellatospora sp. NPDC049609]|uniref:hypothetical protein n=1 Tax=Catellatospora sp. NPDC049609 TaxID=3155505 RepID=UPI003431889E